MKWNWWTVVALVLVVILWTHPALAKEEEELEPLLELVRAAEEKQFTTELEGLEALEGLQQTLEEMAKNLEEHRAAMAEVKRKAAKAGRVNPSLRQVPEKFTKALEQNEAEWVKWLNWADRTYMTKRLQLMGFERDMLETPLNLLTLLDSEAGLAESERLMVRLERLKATLPEMLLERLEASLPESLPEESKRLARPWRALELDRQRLIADVARLIVRAQEVKPVAVDLSSLVPQDLQEVQDQWKRLRRWLDGMYERLEQVEELVKWLGELETRLEG